MIARPRRSPMPADAHRGHTIRLPSLVALRIAPEKNHEPIAGARLPACDLGAYSSLHHVLGLVRVLEEGVRSALSGVSLLQAAEPALPEGGHGASPKL
jgi:hypothetical protein